LDDGRLRFCPFCGFSAVVVGSNRGHYVECQNCHARTDYFIDGLDTNDKSEKMAIEAWNKRIKNDNFDLYDTPIFGFHD